MVIAADYGLAEVLWTMVALFLWLTWFALLIRVLADLFRDPEASGGTKALWTAVVLVLPFVGVFLYLVVRGDGMAGRIAPTTAGPRPLRNPMLAEPTDRLRGAEELAQAKALLDDGVISQAEYDGLRARA